MTKSKGSVALPPLAVTEGKGDLGFLTWVYDAIDEAGAAVEHAYRHLAEHLLSSGEQVIHERIFGDLKAAETMLEARRIGLGSTVAQLPVPPTVIDGRPCPAGSIAGFHISTVRPQKTGIRDRHRAPWSSMRLPDRRERCTVPQPFGSGPTGRRRARSRSRNCGDHQARRPNSRVKRMVLPRCSTDLVLPA